MFIHWMMVNVPGNNLNGGTEVVSYMGMLNLLSGHHMRTSVEKGSNSIFNNFEISPQKNVLCPIINFFCKGFRSITRIVYEIYSARVNVTVDAQH